MEELIELRELRASQPQIRGVVLATSDGHVVATALGAGLATAGASTAAMVAALLGIARRVTGLLGGDLLEELVLRTGHGRVVVRAVGPDEVLTVLTGDGLNLGLLQLELRHLVPELAARPRGHRRAS